MAILQSTAGWLAAPVSRLFNLRMEIKALATNIERTVCRSCILAGTGRQFEAGPRYGTVENTTVRTRRRRGGQVWYHVEMLCKSMDKAVCQLPEKQHS